MKEVNWNEVTSGNYVTLDEGKPKTMVLKNWRPQIQFKDDKTGETRPGVVFEVHEEDGSELETIKEWTVTAKGALKGLKPLCEKAEAAGNEVIKVSVVAVGKGRERQYSINEA